VPSGSVTAVQGQQVPGNRVLRAQEPLLLPRPESEFSNQRILQSMLYLLRALGGEIMARKVDRDENEHFYVWFFWKFSEQLNF